jgi:hypothetical protein
MNLWRLAEPRHSNNKINDIIVEANITPLEKAYSLKKYVIEELIKNPTIIALKVFFKDSLPFLVYNPKIESKKIQIKT